MKWRRAYSDSSVRLCKWRRATAAQVSEHATLINACLNPCPVDESITIYECETGEIPNLDAIPEVGSFAVRFVTEIKKSDFKLSSKNQAGVFIGFATLKRHLRVSAHGGRGQIRGST